MLGGVVFGGYVDRTKQFRRVLLLLLAGSFCLLAVLGVAEGLDDAEVRSEGPTPPPEPGATQQRCPSRPWRDTREVKQARATETCDGLPELAEYPGPMAT